MSFGAPREQGAIVADDDTTQLATETGSTAGGDTAAGATPLLAGAPTQHARLLEWVAEIAELTHPYRIVW